MSATLYWHRPSVARDERERLNGHRACAVWFTGLSGAGKSTLAHALERRLHEAGCRTFTFDGDNVRHGLCSDLGFSADDRHENARRVGELLRLFVEAGVITLAAFVSPYRADRARLADRIGRENFFEIYCRCSLEICEARDTKGIYRRARRGEIPEFTGISAPYEAPLAADLTLDTGTEPLDACAERVIALLRSRGVLDAEGSPTG